MPTAKNKNDKVNRGKWSTKVSGEENVTNYTSKPTRNPNIRQIKDIGNAAQEINLNADEQDM